MENVFENVIKRKEQKTKTKYSENRKNVYNKIKNEYENKL